MDNITHSLIGLAAGESVARITKKQRVPIWIASAAANNLPDLDVLITSFIFKGKANYLLHHRGHTHTLLLAPLLSLFLAVLLFIVWRSKKDFPWREVLLVVFLGPFLHLFADYWNSYGVHPFWPWNNEWFYGDMVFIVEPWIWIILIPALTFSCVTKWGKGFLLLPLAAIQILAWIHPLVPWAFALALSLAVAPMFFLFAKIRDPLSRNLSSIFLLGILLGAMKLTSLSIEQRFPKSIFNVVALSPYPANPFCWIAIHSSLGAEEYRATISIEAPFPGIVAAKSCTNFYNSGTTAPLLTSTNAENFASKNIGTFVGKKEKLEKIWQNCSARAFFRFLRNPFWIQKEGGWILGDLRYDRETNIGFGEEFFPNTNLDCPKGEPPWIGRFHPERFLSN
jgi:inner membrane protein